MPWSDHTFEYHIRTADYEHARSVLATVEEIWRNSFPDNYTDQFFITEQFPNQWGVMLRCQCFDGWYMELKQASLTF